MFPLINTGLPCPRAHPHPREITLRLEVRAYRRKPVASRPGLGMNYFSLTPADLACYSYAMVNRQDALYSPASPAIGRRPLATEIIFDGTKLALDRGRSKTTTDGMNCSFQLFSNS